MAVTKDWELEFAGLTVGADTAFGVTSVKGLLDMPKVRTSDLTLLRRHGSFAGDDFLDARTITLEFSIFADGEYEMQERIGEFVEAFKIGDEQALMFQLPGVAGGVPARVWCRTRRRSVNMDLEYMYGVAKATVQLVAADPRIYVEQQQSDNIGLLVVSGGVTFPMTFNLTFGTVGSGGSMLLDNSGSFDAPVVFRIDGPVTDPVITNDTTGQVLSFTGFIGAGSYYVVDTAARSVLLNGTASRYNTIDASSDWFDLAPGLNSISFDAASYEADALLTATWRSASV
jgi:hypothetical protein